MATRLTVRGRVQGVGYRQWMCGEAVRLGLDGWVRNRIDGSVEAVIDGPQPAVAAMVESARRGPPAARVSSVDTEDIEGRFSGFEARPTA
jgi:acylphosphatase